MGITKTEGFSKETAEMADILKVIGHPARLTILKFLAKTPSCICNDIVDIVPLSQPTISRHLSELKRVGLIRGTFEGKNICYCIDQSTWTKVKSTIDDLSGVLDRNLNCC